MVQMTRPWTLASWVSRRIHRVGRGDTGLTRGRDLRHSGRADRTPDLTRRLGVILWTLALSALVSCGGPQPIPDRFYRLDPSPQVTPETSPVAAILLVTNLSARGFLGGRQIIYRTSAEPLLTQRYDALLWDEPPAGAVSSALIDALRRSNLFRFVVIPSEQSRADYILSGELQRLEHLPTATPPRVAATIHLSLVSGNGWSTIASHTYSDEEDIDGTTPDAMVTAFDRLVSRLIASAIADLQGMRQQLQGGSHP